MFGQAGIPRGKEGLRNRPRTIQKDPTRGGNSPFCRASPPLPFGKWGKTPTARFSRHCVMYSRATQNSFYPAKNTRSWRGHRKRRRNSTPLSIYGTSLGSSTNSVDSNTATSLPAGMYKTSWICECTQGTRPAFAAFEWLLVEDYELFPPEHRKSCESATGTCQCGSKVHDKECILEGSGVDPRAEQEANVPEAGEAQEANVPEVCEAQEANVPEVGKAQETGEAGRTQEKLWELPKKIRASKAVYNIQNNDNDCFYWTIQFATKLQRLQEMCGCG